MKITIDHIKGLFPTATANMPKISTTGSRPNFTTLTKFQDALNKNAMVIASNETKLGHLGTVLNSNKYKKVNGKVWKDPVEPNSEPSKPKTSKGDNTDPYEAQEAIRSWQEKKDTYNTFRLTTEALKAQIIASVDDQYINELEAEIIGYTNIAPQQLMAHLWKNYGTIEVSDLTINEETMKAPWNPPTPIEDLFKQLREGQKFAKLGGESISNDQLARYAYENILKTGVFDKACKKWRLQDATDQTWDKLQPFFTLEAVDYEKNTSAEAAQYTAAQVQEILDENVAAQLQQMMNQNAAAAEATVATAPTTTPAAYVPQPSANALTAANVKRIVQARLQSNGGPRGGRRKRDNTRNQPQVCQGHNAAGEPITYCWTHGITKNLRHNSITCKHKAEGHKDEAILNNKLNGSEVVCERRT